MGSKGCHAHGISCSWKMTEVKWGGVDGMVREVMMNEKGVVVSVMITSFS